MIRLEKAGREDLAALVQLQEMGRARLLPEIREQPLPLLELPPVSSVEDLPAFADAVLDAVREGIIAPATAGQLFVGNTKNGSSEFCWWLLAL